MLQPEVQYSVFKAVFRPFWMVSDKLGAFCFWGGIFGLVLTGVALLFSAAFDCTLHLSGGQAWCVEKPFAYMAYFFTKLLLITVFVRLWVEAVVMKDENDSTTFKQTFIGVLKTFLCFMLFMSSIFLPIIATYILFLRVPNPNFVVELAFFTFFALWFLAPFVLMRFYGSIGERLEDARPTRLKEVWRKTSGFSFKLLLSTALIYMVVLTLYLSANSSARGMPHYAGLFVQNFILLLNAALVACFMLVQRQIFLSTK